MWMLENAFLIPLIPALSFAVILFFGKRFIGSGRVHLIGITAVSLIWVLSLVAAFQWTQRVEHPSSDAIAQISVDDHGDDHGDDHNHNYDFE